VKATVHQWGDQWLNLAAKVMAYGFPASQVAKAINNVYKTNLTRNSVIGQINRRRAAGDERFLKLPDVEKISGKSLTFLFESWKNGIAANEIADYYGIHRNTVGKKAFEYGFDPRDQNFYSKSKKQERKVTREAEKGGFVYKPFKARDTFPNEKARGVSMLELNHNECRFVIGDGPYLFCGAPIEPGSGTSYCPTCHRIIYVPSQPSLKQARRV